VRTGILGGTFDPIHIAHLHAGECAMYQAGLDRVLFMPAGEPWQKRANGVTPGHHRLEMTRIAVDGVDGFEADSREVDRSGPSYTIDTLDTMEGDDLFLILGADAASRIGTWHRASEVLERVTILVAPRPGTDSTFVADSVPGAMFLDMAVLEVSGTEIRHLASTGQPFRFLVTEGVHRYVTEKALYTEPQTGDMVEGDMKSEESS
jgi:nicotinate-nucleotide adenylyltransferase